MVAKKVFVGFNSNPISHYLYCCHQTSLLKVQSKPDIDPTTSEIIGQCVLFIGQSFYPIDRGLVFDLQQIESLNT